MRSAASSGRWWPRPPNPASAMELFGSNNYGKVGFRYLSRQFCIPSIARLTAQQKAPQRCQFLRNTLVACSASAACDHAVLTPFDVVHSGSNNYGMCC